MSDANVDLGGTIHHCDANCPHNLAGSAPRKARPGRKARPHPSAKHFGPYGAVSLSVRRTRGGGFWVEVTSITGRWYVNFDAAIADVLDQVLKGGHIVEEPRVNRG